MANLLSNVGGERATGHTGVWETLKANTLRVFKFTTESFYTRTERNRILKSILFIPILFAKGKQEEVFLTK